MNDYQDNKSTGTSWQSMAGESVVTDTEGTGKTSHVKPAPDKDQNQTAPASNWPYRS